MVRSVLWAFSEPLVVLVPTLFSIQYCCVYYIVNFIPDTCIKHLIGRVNGRSRHGNIYSPDYPLEYPNNADCVWKISVPDNAVLQLTLIDFDSECRHDFLETHHLNTAEGSIKRYIDTQMRHIYTQFSMYIIHVHILSLIHI